MPKRQLDWVHTTGGPHMIVPAKHAIHWEGVGEPSHGRVVQAKFRYDPSGPATDYDRACDIKGWAGVIRVGRGYGIVLGDYPTSAAYYHWDNRHFILRWVYADSEKELLKQFHKVVAALSVEEEVSFRLTDNRLFLLDSSDLPKLWLGEHSEFELPFGKYRITTMRFESEQTSFIAHEWQRISS